MQTGQARHRNRFSHLSRQPGVEQALNQRVLGLRVQGMSRVMGAIAFSCFLTTACNSASNPPPTPTPSESTRASEETPTQSEPPPPSSPTVTVSPTSTPEPVAKAEVEPDSPPLPEPLPVVPTTAPLTPPPIDTVTLPVPKPSELSAPLAKGTFVLGEQHTQGTFAIVDDEGTAIIQFDDNFQTPQSPDLFVVLHVADDVLATTTSPNYPLETGDYVAIAPLKTTQGRQAYSIPAAVILDNYNSLAIWDRHLNTTLGTASLDYSTN